MRVARWLRHCLRSPRAVDRALPPAVLERIEETIAVGEASHRGEVRVAIEAALPWSYLKRNAPARQRAEMLFAKLRVWDTEDRSGVLIYLDLADRAIEIVADRGATRAVPADAWEPMVRAMTERLRNDDFEGALITGIDQVNRLLARAFPPIEGRHNADELPNRPVILGR